MGNEKLVNAAEVVGALNRLIQEADASKKSGYLGAYKLAYYIAGVPLPQEFLDAQSDSDKLTVIRDAFATRRNLMDQTLIQSINYAFSQLKDDELETALHSIRGLLFNGLTVNDDGFCCDKDGNPAENYDFKPKAGAKIAEWLSIKYRHKKTREKITKEAYGLSGTEKGSYEPIRFMMLPTMDGSMPEIYEDDYLWLKEGIAKDIEKHPKMLARYISESGTPHSGNDKGGKLFDYRDVIAVSMAKIPTLEYAKGKTLEKSVANGMIKSWWHMQIAILVTLYCDTKESSLVQATDDDLSRWLDTIGIFSDPKSTITLPDEELKLYRNADGESLPGRAEGKQVKDNATLAQQKEYLCYMGEELLIRLHHAFGNREDVRTSAVIKKLGKLYYSIICDR